MAVLESPNNEIINASILSALIMDSTLTEKELSLINKWMNNEPMNPKDFLSILNQLDLRVIKIN